MLANLIDWSARNKFVVLLATLLIVLGGVVAVWKTPLDALPDLSDVQVIVYTEYPGQAPQVVEDQVTYPLTTAMLAVPKSRWCAASPSSALSFVYVIFEDGTDIYWARSRVLEYLNFARRRLPAGVTPSSGPTPPASAGSTSTRVLGQDRTLAELRSLQDWYLRYQLTVSAGRGRGGQHRRLRAAVPGRRRSGQAARLRHPAGARSAGDPRVNRDVGGRVVEMAETEYMVRGRGYLRGIADIEQIVGQGRGRHAGAHADVARVELGPDERRGIAELNGEGEVVSGIVVARYGENALAVIDNVKAEDRLEIAPACRRA
jgi:copper/silver efflux system protein